MSRRRIVIGCIAAPIVLFILIQLIPVWLLQTNPPVVAEPPWNSPQTRALAQRACFDCHSNATNWPWFTRIAPGSWLVTLDVIRGRDHLNFSTYRPGQSIGEGEGGARGATRMARMIESGEMPPGNYLLLHPEAQLTAAEKQVLIQGLQAMLK
ncbi:MAG: heme-binding domain-containing protein [Anaerolineae bacterium]